MFKPQTKHKANHGGYKKKPTKQQVNSLLELYGKPVDPKKK